MSPHPYTPSPNRFLPTQSKARASSPREHALPQSHASSQFAPPPSFRLSHHRTSSLVGPASHTPHFSSPLIRRPPRGSKEEDIESAPSSSSEDGHEGASNTQRHLELRSPEHKRRRIDTGSASGRHDDIILISSSPSACSTASSTSEISNDCHKSAGRSRPTTPPALAPRAALPAQQRPDQHSPHPFHKPQPQHQPLRSRFLINPSKTNTPATVTPAPFQPQTPFQEDKHQNQRTQHPLPTSGAPLLLPRRSPTPSPPTQSAFFSPSRRKGKKFVPGGLAMKVREWVLEMGEAGRVERRQYQQQQRGTGQGQADDGEHGRGRKVRVAKGGVREVVEGGVGGGGVLVVATDLGNGEARTGKWLLVSGAGGLGDGVRGRAQQVVVTEGMVIKIGPPTWDVTIGGEVCGVAVEWKVVKGEEHNAGV